LGKTFASTTVVTVVWVGILFWRFRQFFTGTRPH
jgi:hypothetical protein